MHQTWTQGLNVVMSNASSYLNTFRFRCCEDALSAITLDRLGSLHIYGGLQLFIILALITFTVALIIACWLDLKGTNIIELIKEWAQTKNKKIILIIYGSDTAKTTPSSTGVVNPAYLVEGAAPGVWKSALGETLGEPGVAPEEGDAPAPVVVPGGAPLVVPGGELAPGTDVIWKSAGQ